VLVEVRREAALADPGEVGCQLRERADRAGRPARQRVGTDQRRYLTVGHPRQQHLARRHAVRRGRAADAGAHPDDLVALDGVHDQRARPRQHDQVHRFPEFAGERLDVGMRDVTDG
jgi:hypothetical protein